jgi:hypothetical protein
MISREVPNVLKNMILVAGALAALATLPAAAPRAVPTTAAESNAAANAGDIPDTQAFVTYNGPGYSVLVPEGWSRVQRGSAVTFTWNANGEAIDTTATRDLVAVEALLRAHYGAMGRSSMRSATIGGSAVTVLSFSSNSKPNPVTGKKLRLDNQAYLFSGHGRRAMLVLWAPAGADNVDQWKNISASFRWK